MLWYRPKKGRATKKNINKVNKTSKELLMVIVGRTKIPYNDLFCLNNKEIESILEGHEIDYKASFERSRMLASITLLPHLKKGAKLDVKKIWSLPWDSEKVEKQIDTVSILEKQRMAKEKFDKLKKKKNGESIS